MGSCVSCSWVKIVFETDFAHNACYFCMSEHMLFRLLSRLELWTEISKESILNYESFNIEVVSSKPGEHFSFYKMGFSFSCTNLIVCISPNSGTVVRPMTSAGAPYTTVHWTIPSYIVLPCHHLFALADPIAPTNTCPVHVGHVLLTWFFSATILLAKRHNTEGVTCDIWPW